MLTSTLRKLEQDGLLSRKVYPEVPPRVEYALTPRGESLMPHLTALIGWAEEISTPSSKTGSGKRYSDGQGLPGKSSGYPRTAPCRQPTAKRCQPTAK